MKRNVWRWILISVFTLAVAAAVLVLTRRNRAVRPVSVRAERVAAESVLARKLSGPRYFNAPANKPIEDDGLWIDVEDAQQQVPGIVAARKLGPGATEAIGRLIEKLSEPHPYRMVGGKRINLSRLNLSLDSIN